MPSETIPSDQTEGALHKKDIVRLSDEERRPWAALISQGQAAAYKIRHAHSLLQADAAGPAWTDTTIAESFSVSVNTVLGVRQRLVEQGFEAALHRKPPDHPSRPPRLDGAGEARLMALRRAMATVSLGRGRTRAGRRWQQL